MSIELYNMLDSVRVEYKYDSKCVATTDELIARAVTSAHVLFVEYDRMFECSIIPHKIYYLYISALWKTHWMYQYGSHTVTFVRRRIFIFVIWLYGMGHVWKCVSFSTILLDVN